MITLTIRPSRTVKRYKNSVYVHIPYDPTLMSIIKSFSGRVYHADLQEWEVPSKHFSKLVDVLDEYNMEIIGEIPKDVDKKLSLLDRFYESRNVQYGFDFKTKPFKHQQECFDYAQTHRKFLLGDEQGLGKTKQSIDIAVSRKGQFKHCLIVCCVNGLKWNWQNEVEVHSHETAHILGEYTNRKGNKVIGSVKQRLEDLNTERDEFFLITNIETVRNADVQKRLNTMCSDGTIGMVIIDEIHKCCNSTSSQGKAIHSLCSYYKMALTGTPLMNSPVDLYNILKWLDVENHTLTQFKGYYCIFGGGLTQEIVGYKHMNELQKTLNRCMLRRKKEDALDLPDKVRTVEYLEMTKEQTKLYNDIKDMITKDIDRILLQPNPLTELIRLRQCTGYPGILSSAITKSVKIDRLQELVAEATEAGEKVVVFSNWTSVTDPAYKALQPYNPALVTGEVKNKAKEVKRFQSDETCKVIVGTIAAMGTGFTLTAANTVIFLDSPWNRANKEQAEDRAHRIGTKGTVRVITLVAKDTIDERIEYVLEAKGQLSDIVVDGQPSAKINKGVIDFLLS